LYELGKLSKLLFYRVYLSKCRVNIKPVSEDFLVKEVT
ncbi:hypothetical protein LCGC14_2861640, partial [marine sediment metagenome]